MNNNIEGYIKMNKHHYVCEGEIKEAIRGLSKEKQDMILAAIEKKDDLTLKELLEQQSELDQFIVEKSFNAVLYEKIPVEGNSKEFLTDRILALQTEVSEFANEVESFKYWKENKKNNREKQLSEYVDILHFWLSIGNTMQFTAGEIQEAYTKKYKENIQRQKRGY